MIHRMLHQKTWMDRQSRSDRDSLFRRRAPPVPALCVHHRELRLVSSSTACDRDHYPRLQTASASAFRLTLVRAGSPSPLADAAPRAASRTEQLASPAPSARLGIRYHDAPELVAGCSFSVDTGWRGSVRVPVGEQRRPRQDQDEGAGRCASDTPGVRDERGRVPRRTHCSSTTFSSRPKWLLPTGWGSRGQDQPEGRPGVEPFFAASFPTLTSKQRRYAEPCHPHTHGTCWVAAEVLPHPIRGPRCRYSRGPPVAPPPSPKAGAGTTTCPPPRPTTPTSRHVALLRF